MQTLPERVGASVAVGARRVVMTLDLDVTDQQSCQAAVAATVEHAGGLDVLVNNAGLMLVCPILGADTTEWTRMVHTNLLGTMYNTHAALPRPLRSKGTVLQTSSTSGRIASPGGGVYAATKFGVNAFSKALRQEVAAPGCAWS